MILHGFGETSEIPVGNVPELTAYAQKAATNIVSMTVGMIDEYRQPILKATLDAVYPGLHEMAVEEANKANARLSRSADTRVNEYLSTREGIAAAIERYVARETLAKGQAAAQQRPLNGARLGQSISAGARAAMAQNAAPTSTSTWIAPSLPADGECTSDGRNIWRAATSTIPGHWERRRASEQCAVIGAYESPESRGGGGGVTVTDEAGNIVDTDVVAVTPEEMLAAQKALMYPIGPFYIPTFPDRVDGKITWTKGVAFPRDWSKKIADLFAADQYVDVYAGRGTMQVPYPRTNIRGTPYEALRDFIPDIPDNISLACLGAKIVGAVDTFREKFPLIKIKHPKTNEDYALYMEFVASPDAPQLVFQWQKVPEPSWLGKAIAAIVGAIVDFFSQVASWIKDGACALFSSSIGTAVGSAIGVGAAAYLGVDPKIGATIGSAGAKLISNACQANPPPKPAPSPPSPPSGSMLPFVIGGAALLGVLLLARKPKPL
jgi:hypothetical protein